MAFVAKEIPTGTIDGVNKVFTLANTPAYIDDVFVDGAVYTTFSLVGNVLTLVDAPTLSLFVDYESGASVIPITTTVTLGDIKSKVWDLLGQKSSSINFSTNKVQEEINNISLDIWRGRKTNLLSQQIIRAGNLWFQDGTYNFRVKTGSVLTAVANVGDITLYMDTTNINSSGYVLIGGDRVNYTSKTATQLIGVSGITAQHLVGDRVIQLYSLPTDFETVIGLRKVVYGSLGTNYADLPLNTGTIRFEILRNGATSLVKVNGLYDNDLVEVKYTKKYNDLTSDTDICPFPDRYGLTVIAQIVAGEMGYVKGLPSSERILNIGYANLKAMYQYFTNETKVIKQKIMPTSYQFNTMKVGRTYR